MKEQDIEYLLTAKLGTLVYDIAMQAMHAKDNGDLTLDEFNAVLNVMNRVHTKYSIQLRQQRQALLRKRKFSRQITVVVLAAFGLAFIISTALIIGVYG